MHRIVSTTKNYWDQNVNSIDIEKPPNRHEITFQPFYLQSHALFSGLHLPRKTQIPLVLSSTKPPGVSVTFPNIRAQYRTGRWAGHWVPFLGTPHLS